MEIQLTKVLDMDYTDENKKIKINTKDTKTQ